MNAQNYFFTACVIIFLGCQKPVPQKENWAGTITIAENKSLPFKMFIDLSPSLPVAYFLNGNEQTQIPEIRVKDDSLSFIFSEYGAAMLGVWNGKEWRGRFFRYRADTSWNEFTASPTIISKEKDSDKSVKITLDGKYQAFIETRKGIDSTTIANFWMENDSIYGTLIAPDGDYGLLVGTQEGNKALLYRFTGWQAFIMELGQNGTTWDGNLFARSGKPMKFSLKPFIKSSREFKLEKSTVMKNPKVPFSFFGMTSSGQFMGFKDERFKNKTLLIDIMGTWCHNCMDAAPLLQQLYSEYHKDGLEVVGLAFEISDNPELAKKNLTLFQKRYGITYNVLFCGSTKDINVDPKLHAQLNNFYGYPTTLFVDKRGIVKEIHTGFKGPGTGEEYQQQVQQYYESVKKLLK